MATDVKNKLIEIDGNLVYCKKASSERYHSGVSFLASEDEKKAFVTKLIKEYNFRKSSPLSDN
jgi:hypothetical protein